MLRGLGLRIRLRLTAQATTTRKQREKETNGISCNSSHDHLTASGRNAELTGISWRTVLVRGHRACLRPLANGLHFLGARYAERPRALNFGDQDFRGELLLRAERRVQARDDGLLDLRPGKSV